MRCRAVWIAIVILFLFFSIAGCRSNQVVAEVNGTKITQAELDEYIAVIKLFMPQMDEMVEDESYWDMIKSDMLNFLIETTLVNQEVERLNLSVDEEKVKSMAGESRAELVEMVYGSEEELIDRMNSLNIDSAVLEKLIRAGLQNEILLQHVTGTITEQDLRNFVEENPDFLMRPAYVDASHILVETEEEAEEVIKRLNAGEDFAELAAEVSIDENAEYGGLLGRIFEGDHNFDPDFCKAAFALEENEISDPVKTVYGYHIIKVTGKGEAREQTFEEVKEEVEYLKRQSLYGEYFANLWDSADIKIYLD